MTSTATTPPAETARSIAPGWAVLGIDELRLALPQRDLRRFELASDLEAPGAKSAPAAGQFTAADDASWPAYNLDGTLHLQRVTPGARSLCAFFDAEGQTRGLLCDRVWSLAEDADLVVEALPGCMKGPPSPATGLARFQGRIAMVTNRDAISSYLAFLLEQTRVEHED